MALGLNACGHLDELQNMTQARRARQLACVGISGAAAAEPCVPTATECSSNSLPRRCGLRPDSCRKASRCLSCGGRKMGGQEPRKRRHRWLRYMQQTHKCATAPCVTIHEVLLAACRRLLVSSTFSGVARHTHGLDSRTHTATPTIATPAGCGTTRHPLRSACSESPSPAAAAAPGCAAPPAARPGCSTPSQTAGMEVGRKRGCGQGSTALREGEAPRRDVPFVQGQACAKTACPPGVPLAQPSCHEHVGRRSLAHKCSPASPPCSRLLALSTCASAPGKLEKMGLCGASPMKPHWLPIVFKSLELSGVPVSSCRQGIGRTDGGAGGGVRGAAAALRGSRAPGAEAHAVFA